LQLLKNIVPLPEVPEIGGSSPWWAIKLKILGNTAVWQKPTLFFSRLTRQRRGQIWQDSRDKNRESAMFFNFPLL
jgi:hypothetical protein